MFTCGIGHEMIETTGLVDEEIRHVKIAVLPRVEKGRLSHIVDELMEGTVEFAINYRAARLVKVDRENTCLQRAQIARLRIGPTRCRQFRQQSLEPFKHDIEICDQIGRASCRERVCQSV